MVSFVCAVVLMTCVVCIASLSDSEIALFTPRNSDVNSQAGVACSVSISEDAGTLTLTSNGVPDHETTDLVRNPNTIGAQSYTVTFNKNPVLALRTWCVPRGIIGYATNGVPFFNALTKDDTDALTTEEFDTCGGHAASKGDYHYHAHPLCIAGDGVQGALVGVAVDGNPIYGLDSSVDVSLLDECQGYEVNGVYRYQITDRYPYTLGCYHSKPPVVKREGAGCFYLTRKDTTVAPATTTAPTTTAAPTNPPTTTTGPTDPPATTCAPGRPGRACRRQNRGK